MQTQKVSNFYPGTQKVLFLIKMAWWELSRLHWDSSWPEVIPGLPLLSWDPIENKVVPLVLFKVVPGLEHSKIWPFFFSCTSSSWEHLNIWPFFETYIFSCTSSSWVFKLSHFEVNRLISLNGRWRLMMTKHLPRYLYTSKFRAWFGLIGLVW